MGWAKGQSGNPAGRKPGPRTIYKREVDSAMRTMADALPDTTASLIDLARGVRVVQVLDGGTGTWKALPPAQGGVLGREPLVLQAMLDSGTARVYISPPDLDAIRVLHERIMGKAPTHTELAMKPRFDQLVADHAALAEVITRHVPQEYLGPVVAFLERVARRDEAPGADEQQGPLPA